MKNQLFLIITLIIFLFSCKKEESNNIDSTFDISEGQTNWTKIPYISIDNKDSDFNTININDIFFINNETGYMAGGDTYHETSSIIYKTEDGGTSWKVNYKEKCGGGSTSHSIFFPTPTTGFAVHTCMGYYRTTKTTDGGNTWVQDNTDASPQYYIIDSLNIIFGNFRTQNGGDTWELISSPPFTTSYYFKDIGYGVCSTTKGLIAETLDFGTTWDTLYYNDNNSFNSIFMPDTSTIIAGGRNIIKSIDKGNSWIETYSEGYINDIKFIDKNTGFAALSNEENQDFGYYSSTSGKILKTIDGGDSWSVNYRSNFMSFNDLEILNSGTIISCGRQGDYSDKVNKGYFVKTTTLGN